MKFTRENAVTVIYLLVFLMVLTGLTGIINDRNKEIQKMRINNQELNLQLENLHHQLEIYQDVLLRDKQKILELQDQIEELRRIRARVTAYAPFDNQSGICNDKKPSSTSTGTKPQWGTLAVDPKVIPYGTKLYIPGYGTGIAEDTGGALRGKNDVRIDVYMDTYKQSRQWGVQWLDVQIII